MSTDCLFREDAYLKECSATVVGITDAGGIVLDRTVFYAASAHNRPTAACSPPRPGTRS
jgi:Ser-tRNA(Ala) deacylase AlaX